MMKAGKSNVLKSRIPPVLGLTEEFYHVSSLLRGQMESSLECEPDGYLARPSPSITSWTW